MDEFLAVGIAPNGVSIYLSELSEKTLEDNGLLNTAGGLYLYEACDAANSFGIRVLASVPTCDAGYRMMDLLRLKLSA